MLSLGSGASYTVGGLLTNAGAVVVGNGATLTATAPLLHAHEQMALFVAGAVALALLLLGIHNSWDAVTHLVLSDANHAETETD